MAWLAVGVAGRCGGRTGRARGVAGRDVHGDRRRAAITRARSRPTAPRSAGATTATGRRRSRPGSAASRRSPPAAYHTCAIKTDGTPVCWGNNGYGQTTIPAGLGSVTQITAGDAPHVRDQDRWHPGLLGRQRLRADDDPGRNRQRHADHRRRLPHVRDHDRRHPGLLGQQRLRADDDPAESAASRRSPPAVTTRARSRPTAPRSAGATTPTGRRRSRPELGSVTQITAGGYHTCAIKTDGTPVCWGYNGYGQTTIPADLGSVTQITAGAYHTCALRTDGARSAGATTTTGRRWCRRTTRRGR